MHVSRGTSRDVQAGPDMTLSRNKIMNMHTKFVKNVHIFNKRNIWINSLKSLVQPIASKMVQKSYIM